jgi:hypothetical protein
VTLTLLPSTSSEPTPQPAPLGSITPRLWTPPLRKLTPASSYGFRVIWFAREILREPLDPWQQWAVIHLGELLEDGRPRFRQVLVLVARQNGKTHLCKVLALYWMFVERQPLTFGTSTKLEQAKKSWKMAIRTAQRNRALRARSLKPRIANGQEMFSTTDDCVYTIGASDAKGGRGDSIDRQIGDELREQHDWEAYNAAAFAMNARPYGQAVYITNQGDARSVVLNSLRDAALAGTDPRLGLLEWSAPPGTHPMDMDGWAAANPQLGRRMDYDTIRGAALRVAKPGADPEELTGFLTEALCMAVDQLNPAIDPAAWEACSDPAPLDVANRMTIAACVDVAPNLQHATLAAAQVLEDGRVRVETLKEWDGPATLATLRAELPDWVAKVRPRSLGWYPGGPAATLDAELRDRRKAGRFTWPPRGVDVAEIKADTPAVVMGFSALVSAAGVAHSKQEMLTAQVEKAERLQTGDRWVITRRGAGNVDAVYAVAGAAHLARTLPRARPVSRTAAAAPSA